jgi:uncharacterized protein (TIRG00374 family)
MKNKLLRASTLFSIFCGIVFIIALICFARIDGGEILDRLLNLNPLGLIALVILWGAYTFVSAEKWLLVERHYNADNVPSRRLAFALTALGWVAGQFFPVQLTTAFMRGLGSKVLAQRNSWHSAAATFYEQIFDLIIVALLGLVSLLCLGLAAPQAWLILVTVTLAVFTMTLRFITAFMQKFLRLLARSRLLTGRMQQFLSGGDKILEFSLIRKLVLLSIAHFILLCAAAAATTYSAGLPVSALHLAIAMPLVALASALPLTPGALGVNEFMFASTLAALGTPFAIGLQWALINRLLVISSSLLIGSIGVLLLWGGKKISRSA